MSPSDLVETRKPLTRREIVELAVRQLGKCGCGCGFKLDAMVEGVIDEHLIPLEQTGSNDLKNRALYRKPCAAAKTKTDARNTAKCKRLAGETCAEPSRRPMPSRPFPTDLRKRMNGKVERRDQP